MDDMIQHMIDSLDEGLQAQNARLTEITSERERLSTEFGVVSGEIERLTKAKAALGPLVEGEKPKAEPKRRKKRWTVSGPPVPAEAVRDYAVQMREFTAKQVAEHFKRSDSWADNMLKPLRAKGIIEGHRDSGNVPLTFRYIEPTGSHRLAVVGAETVARGGGGPVPGTGTRRTGSKDVRPLLNTARSQGYEVDQSGGHIDVRDPKTGRSKKISTSPSDRNAHKQIKRDLIQLGVRF